MTDDSEDFGVTLGRWLTVVRRARLDDPKRKCFVHTVGGYANTDGTRVKAGVARISTDCEMGYSTARRYLAWMREVGLIELARAGNGKHATRADEYRLTIQPHTEKALDCLTEAEYGDLIQGRRKANSEREKNHRLLRSPKEVSTEGDDDSATALIQEVSAVPRESAKATALIQEVSAVEVYCAHPLSELPPIETRSPPTGGAPPPGPRRAEPPPSSGSRIEAEQSLIAAHYAAQDQQGESLPHASARGPAPPGQLAPVVYLESWRAS